MAEYNREEEWARDICDIEEELMQVSDRHYFLQELARRKHDNDRSGFMSAKTGSNAIKERVQKITDEIMSRYKGCI